MPLLQTRVLDREVRGYFAHGITVAPGDTVVDVGANVGRFSLHVARRCGGDVALYCVEPVPQIREALAKNVARATIVPWAIGATAGSVELDYFPRVPGQSRLADDLSDEASWIDYIERAAHGDPRFGRLARLVPHAGYAALGRFLRGKRVRVQAEQHTLSELIDRYGLGRIALVKLDIEGAELGALRGLRAEHWPSIQQLVIEIHDRERDLAAVKSLLEHHGFGVSVGQLTCGDAHACCNVYATR